MTSPTSPIQHRSVEWQDKVLAAIMGEQSIDEAQIRKLVFDCWNAGYRQGHDVAFRQYAIIKEDMGR